MTAAATKKRGLTSNTLKLIAIVLMLLDHFAVVFTDVLYATDSGITVHDLLRSAARIAFPLFAFFIAVGATYTKNIYKYMLRLFAFAIISEIPFDLALNGKWLEFGYQNVFFTLFLGLLSVFLYQKLREYHLEFLAVLLLIPIAYAAEEWLQTDYGATGVVCIFLFYIFMQAPTPVRQIGFALTCAVITFMLYIHPYTEPFYYDYGGQRTLFHLDLYAIYNKNEFFAIAAAPFMILYNGEKGFHMNRWFFYAFYPGHLLLLWLAHVIFVH